MDLTGALSTAVEAVQEAGRMLREEFHRQGGPEGAGCHAPVDFRVEQLLRRRLLEAWPDWSFRGEETGIRRGSDPSRWWVVDPDDGTVSFLRGERGFSVSVALVEDGVPVLGVVYAPCYPDDRGDLLCWARGCGPVRRWGEPLPAQPPPERLSPRSLVLLSPAAERRPAPNLRCTHPARYRALPSIAYRLALVAAGEGAAGTSLNRPSSVDYAAGHALLRGAGGVLLAEGGVPVDYDSEAHSRVDHLFGAAWSTAEALARRPWESVFAGAPPDEGGLPFPVRLEPGRAVSDPELLSRAQGLLLGQVAGDSLGSLVEFAPAEAIAERHPEGPWELADGGTWDLLAGQPTDNSEMALTLARTLVRDGEYRPESVLESYRVWRRSGPFDCDLTTRQGLEGSRDAESQCNGSLVRVSPLALAGVGHPRQMLEWAEQDSLLTHPNPVCVDACRAYVAALGAGLEGGDAAAMHRRAREVARLPEVRDCLKRSERAPPADFQTRAGGVLVCLQNAFYRLLHAPDLRRGVVDTVRCGGDTDTNAAVAGALLGACYGREAVPPSWRLAVLSCRPHPGFAACRRPRPAFLWPVDAYELAERLVLL